MGQCFPSTKETIAGNILINNNVTTESHEQAIVTPNGTSNHESDNANTISQKFKQPGVCNLTRTNNLKEDLKELQQIYQQQYQPLLQREFEIIQRSNISQVTRNQNTMTIMQFNMLADGLTGAYTLKETDKTFLKVDKSCLELTYRGLRLVEEMTRFNPDIICVEECDIFDFLMEYLEPMGYVGAFQEKSESPIKEVKKEIAQERNGENPKMPNDGVAIIYKQGKFELIGDVQKIDMKQNKEKVFALAVPLVCKQSTSHIEFLMVCTHLKSTKEQEGEELRERQIRLLFSELIKNERNLPIIFCADLNANPIKNRNGYDPLCYNALTNSEFGFRSCYRMALGKEPEYTTWKLRANGTDKHVLDYIFINNNKWEVVGYLQIPEIPEASKEVKSLIPSWNYPSDHFSLMVELAWS